MINLKTRANSYGGGGGSGTKSPDKYIYITNEGS